MWQQGHRETLAAYNHHFSKEIINSYPFLIGAKEMIKICVNGQRAKPIAEYHEENLRRKKIKNFL